MKIFICLIALSLYGRAVVAQTSSQKDSITPVSPTSVPDTDREGDRTFTKVEHEPSFPGGDEAWEKFKQDSLVYPPKALKRKIEGRVMVSFIVETNGSIHQFTAYSDDDPILKEAALDLMRKSPRWVPAQQNHYVVRCYKKAWIDFVLPVKK